MVSRSEIPNNLSTTVSMDAVVKDAHARFESRMKLRLQSVSNAVDFCIRVGVKLSALASDKKEIQQRVCITI